MFKLGYGYVVFLDIICCFVWLSLIFHSAIHGKYLAVRLETETEWSAPYEVSYVKILVSLMTFSGYHISILPSIEHAFFLESDAHSLCTLCSLKIWQKFIPAFFILKYWCVLYFHTPCSLKNMAIGLTLCTKIASGWTYCLSMSYL